MSSRAVSGKPGGGKSYLATLWILEELMSSDRPIVTNVPLILPGIVKYCFKKGRYDIDVYNRILLLSWEDTKHFWRFRGRTGDNCVSEQGGDDYRERGFVADHVTKEDYKSGKRPAIESFPSGGVYYVLDELHEHLNSREWADTGMAVLYYLAKHRHLGDDIVWITQSCANVDKQWRSVTQDYTYCRNWSKEKWNGWSKGSGFEAVTYLDMVPQGAVNLPPVAERREYKLDPDVCACYKTSIVGGKADTGVKQGAWSIRWVYGAIVLAAVSLALLFMFGPDFVTSFFVEKTIPRVSGKGGAVCPPVARKESVMVIPLEGESDVSYFSDFRPVYDSKRCQVVVSGADDRLRLAAAAYRANSVVFWADGWAEIGGRPFIATDRGSLSVGDWCGGPSGVVESITRQNIRIAGVDYRVRWKRKGVEARVSSSVSSLRSGLGEGGGASSSTFSSGGMPKVEKKQ